MNFKKILYQWKKINEIYIDKILVNWPKRVQSVTKFSPHVRYIQRKEYFISAIDLIV